MRPATAGEGAVEAQAETRRWVEWPRVGAAASRAACGRPPAGVSPLLPLVGLGADVVAVERAAEDEVDAAPEDGVGIEAEVALGFSFRAVLALAVAGGEAQAHGRWQPEGVAEGEGRLAPAERGQRVGEGEAAGDGGDQRGAIVRLDGDLKVRSRFPDDRVIVDEPSSEAAAAGSSLRSGEFARATSGVPKGSMPISAWTAGESWWWIRRLAPEKLSHSWVPPFGALKLCRQSTRKLSDVRVSPGGGAGAAGGGGGACCSAAWAAALAALAASAAARAASAAGSSGVAGSARAAPAALPAEALPPGPPPTLVRRRGRGTASRTGLCCHHGRCGRGTASGPAAVSAGAAGEGRSPEPTSAIITGAAAEGRPPPGPAFAIITGAAAEGRPPPGPAFAIITGAAAEGRPPGPAFAVVTGAAAEGRSPEPASAVITSAAADGCPPGPAFAVVTVAAAEGRSPEPTAVIAGAAADGGFGSATARSADGGAARSLARAYPEVKKVADKAATEAGSQTAVASLRSHGFHGPHPFMHGC